MKAGFHGGNKLSKQKWVSQLFLFLISSYLLPSYAIALSSWWKNKTFHPIIAIAGGISNSSDIGQSKNFPIQNPATDEFYNYSANSATQTSGLVDGFVGAELNIQPDWTLQTGIDYNQAAPFSAKGNLVQGADSASADLYSYHYGVLTRQLLIEGKLLYAIKERYHPYLMIGLGAAFNKSYHYYTNASPFLTFTRLYSDYSTTSFSYAAGIGLDMDVNPHLRLGIGYRFADLGNIQLGSAVIDTVHVAGTLSQSHLYTNEVLAQLTYIVF